MINLVSNGIGNHDPGANQPCDIKQRLIIPGGWTEGMNRKGAIIDESDMICSLGLSLVPSVQAVSKTNQMKQ